MQCFPKFRKVSTDTVIYVRKYRTIERRPHSARPTRRVARLHKGHNAMKAAERIGQVLGLFTVTAPERGTGEIAALLGLANSSAHELLNGLAQTGLLQKQAPGRFRLGPMVAALAQVLANTDGLVEAARPIIARTAEDHGETVHVVELAGAGLAALSSQPSTRPVGVSRDVISSETPLHAVAAGKLLLAHLPTAELLRVLDSLELTAFTDETVTARSTLRNRLTEIREAGFAEAVGEWHPDLATCAAPIRSHAGVCIAALSMSVPLSRYMLQPRAYRAIAVQAADRISARLGWRDASKPTGTLPATGAKTSEDVA
ncbi:IclR family transcriptional regulator [Rhodobacteraceae bacterium CCMM004]|nr:IclR family transcriptional regulator [Rhodobacteraceae bacterium CCMM004]